MNPEIRLFAAETETTELVALAYADTELTVYHQTGTPITREIAGANLVAVSRDTVWYITPNLELVRMQFTAEGCRTTKHPDDDRDAEQFSKILKPNYTDFRFAVESHPDGTATIYLGAEQRLGIASYEPDTGIDGFEFLTLSSPLERLEATGTGTAYAVLQNGDVHTVEADGTSKDIGIVNGQVEFTDLCVTTPDVENTVYVYVAADDGRLYRHDDTYHNWTPIGIVNGSPVQSVAYSSSIGLVAVAEGTVLARKNDQRIAKVSTPPFDSTVRSVTALPSGDVFAATEQGTVYRSKNGDDWTSITATGTTGSGVGRECPDCGSVFTKPRYEYCPFDGAELPQHTECPDCEFTAQNDEYVFCPYDGSELV